jgi:DNA polymerase/3'-5' exonuclease PolX
VLTNAAIAELLMREAEAAEGHREFAFSKAARSAFMWPVEANDVREAGRSLTELPGVGPSIAKRIHGWLESPPDVQPPAIRGGFLTLAEARKISKCTQSGATAVER